MCNPILKSPCWEESTELFLGTSQHLWGAGRLLGWCQWWKACSQAHCGACKHFLQRYFLCPQQYNRGVQVQPDPLKAGPDHEIKATGNYSRNCNQNDNYLSSSYKWQFLRTNISTNIYLPEAYVRPLTLPSSLNSGPLKLGPSPI